MKKITYLFGLVLMLSFIIISCNNKKEKKEAVEEKKETEAQTVQDDKWITLFNGKNFDGWRGYGKTEVPKAWTIEDGAIKINGSGKGEAGSNTGGDIIYATKKFKNFELTFEWKVAKGANSGLFYLAQEIEGEPIWKSSPEYQILDNANHPDGKLGKEGNRQSASLYDLIPAKPQNAKPFGEWNSGGVMVYKGTVVHSQNGETVLEYHLWTDDWKKMVEESKFKGWDNFINAGGENQEGYIGLQDHGDDVWFRNIQIKVLD